MVRLSWPQITSTSPHITEQLLVSNSHTNGVSVQTITWPEGGFRGPLTPHRHGDDDHVNVPVINLPLNSRLEAEDIFILNNTRNNKRTTY